MPNLLLKHFEHKVEALKTKRDFYKNTKVVELAKEAAAAKKNALEIATTLVNNLQDRAAAIRKQLATIATKADGDTQLNELEQTMFLLRWRQGLLLQAEAEAELATADAETLANEMSLLEASLQAATIEQSAAQQDRRRRDELIQRVVDLGLKEMKEQAAKAKDSKQYKDAEKRIHDVIPPKLRKAAIDRRDSELKVLKDAEEAAAGARNHQAEAIAETSKTAKVEVRALEVQAAEEGMRSQVESFKERYERALKLLTGIVESPELKPAEIARIQNEELANTAKAALKDPLSDLKKSADTARKSLDDATKELSEGNTPEAQRRVDEASKSLAVAQEAHDAKLHESNVAWEITVPETLWQQLDDFIQAGQDLDALRDTNFESLASTLEGAETNLATALDDLDADLAKLHERQTETSRARVRAEFLLRSIAQRRVVAMRGDGPGDLPEPSPIPTPQNTSGSGGPNATNTPSSTAGPNARSSGQDTRASSTRALPSASREVSGQAQ